MCDIFRAHSKHSSCSNSAFWEKNYFPIVYWMYFLGPFRFLQSGTIPIFPLTFKTLELLKIVAVILGLWDASSWLDRIYTAQAGLEQSHRCILPHPLLHPIQGHMVPVCPLLEMLAFIT